MEKLQILWVTKSGMGAKAGVKSHAHPYYHMFHITGGVFRFCVNGDAYELLPGQTILVPPQVEHGYSISPEGDGRCMELKFALGQSSLDSQLVQSGALVSESPLVEMLFRQILEEYSALGKVADDAAAAYLLAMLNAMCEPERHQKQNHRFRYLDASSYSPLSQRIVRYLESHYSEDLSLDALAASMDYNKSYLCVAFKKDTNQTILDCLNMIRIRRAAELIVYSDHSLAQVSEMCGFASVSHFNRVFLKYAGITPGQCRRAYPADILFGRGPEKKDASSQSERFIYNVLAQKRLTPKEVAQMDANKAEEK